MKLKELLVQLERCDPDLDVICICEDDELLPGEKGFRLFDIITVGEQHGEKLRLKDGTPYFKFERGPASPREIFLEVTSDF